MFCTYIYTRTAPCLGAQCSKARALSTIHFCCGRKIYKKARKWPCWTPRKPAPVVAKVVNYRDAGWQPELILASFSSRSLSCLPRLMPIAFPVNTWTEGQSTATTNPTYPERWLEGWVHVKPIGHSKGGGKPKRRYMVLSEACDLREQVMLWILLRTRDTIF